MAQASSRGLLPWETAGAGSNDEINIAKRVLAGVWLLVYSMCYGCT